MIKIFISWVLLSNLLFPNVFNINLYNGAVFKNCDSISVKEDTLYTTQQFQSNVSRDRKVSLYEIESIVIFKSGEIDKKVYHMAGMSIDQKRETINNLISHQGELSKSNRSYQLRDEESESLQILLVIGVILIVISILVGYFRIMVKRKKRFEEPKIGIKETEALAKKIIDDARKHRREQEERLKEKVNE